MTKLEVNLWGQFRMPMSNVWSQLWSEIIINVRGHRGTGAPLNVSGDLLHELDFVWCFRELNFDPTLTPVCPGLTQTNYGDFGPSCGILLIIIIDTQFFRKPLIDKTLTFTFCRFISYSVFWPLQMRNKGV